MKFPLRCLVLILALSSLVSAEDRDLPPELEPLHGLMVGQGVEWKMAKELVEAIALADGGKRGPLRKFLSHENEICASIAGLFLAFEEPRRTSRTVKGLLAEEKGPWKAHIVTLSIIPQKGTVNLLLKEWKRVEENQDKGILIRRCLTALTEQQFETRKQWVSWWKKERTEMKFQPFGSIEQVQARWVAAMNIDGLRDLRKGLKGASKGAKAQAVLDGFQKDMEKVFEQLEQARELAKKQDHELLRNATTLFRQGHLEQARDAYQRAFAVLPENRDCQFLLGCLELELGNARNALRHFEALADQNDAHGARLMAEVVRRSFKEKERSLFKIATEVVLDHPEESISQLVLGDPILAKISMRQEEGRGVLHPNRELLSEIAAEHSEDLDVQIGVALWMDRRARKAHLEGVLARFPGAPFALAILTQEYGANSLRKSEEERERFQDLAERWWKADPRNLAAYSNFLVATHPDLLSRDGTLRALPEERWQEMVSNASTLALESYRARAVKAQVRVAELSGFPLPWRVGLAPIDFIFFAFSSAVEGRLDCLAEVGDEAELQKMVETLYAFLPISQGTSLVNAKTAHGRRYGLVGRLSVNRGSSLNRFDLYKIWRLEIGRYEDALIVYEILRSFPLPSLQAELGPIYLGNPVEAVELLFGKGTLELEPDYTKLEERAREVEP